MKETREATTDRNCKRRKGRTADRDTIIHCKKTDDDPVDELDSFCVCQFRLVILPNAVIYMLP